MLGYDASEEALAELESEHADDIVIWYGADGTTKPPHELLGLLEAIHGSHRHPTLIPMHSRPDRKQLLHILDRLEFPLEYGAIVMIGNRPVGADLEEIEEMRASGKLEALLAQIGWTEKKTGVLKKDMWKPKLAKAKRALKTEVEDALEEVGKPQQGLRAI